VTRRAIEGPLGVFVVCAESGAPFAVRVYTAAGDLLDEHHEPVSTTPPPCTGPLDEHGQPTGGPIITLTVTIASHLGRPAAGA
jgi:hypothetical protein